MNKSTLTTAVIFLSIVLAPFAWAQGESGTEPAKVDKMRAEQQKLLAEVETIRLEAQQSVEKARMIQAEKRSEQSEETARLREELSRAHQQLRDVSRQVAQAHRDLERADRDTEAVRIVNLGDRAILGVVLGEEGKEGVHIIGVSPDGPAERAGLQQGDVLVSIVGVRLDEPAGGGRKALLKVMDDASPGAELAVEVLRDGEAMNLKVTPEQREPRSWQSVLRLSDAPGHVHDAPRIVVEDFELPEFDEAELALRIEEINKQVQKFKYMFTDEEGKPVEFNHEFEFDGEPFSDIGEHAMREADVWFGLPQTRGLELASLNPDLGKYFKAARGVLVIQARADNAYGLESGDVIQAVGTTEVNSPADLLRALRDAEPGRDIELDIKRDRRDHKLQAKVPENRLGQMSLHHLKRPVAAPAPPETD